MKIRLTVVIVQLKTNIKIQRVNKRIYEVYFVNVNTHHSNNNSY